MIQRCEYCEKVIRGKPVVLFSGSVTGNSTSTILCFQCSQSKDIMDKIKDRNDWILNKMDGLK